MLKRKMNAINQDAQRTCCRPFFSKPGVKKEQMAIIHLLSFNQSSKAALNCVKATLMATDLILNDAQTHRLIPLLVKEQKLK